MPTLLIEATRIAMIVFIAYVFLVWVLETVPLYNRLRQPGITAHDRWYRVAAYCASPVMVGARLLALLWKFAGRAITVLIVVVAIPLAILASPVLLLVVALVLLVQVCLVIGEILLRTTFSDFERR